MRFAIDRATGALTPISIQPAGGGCTTYLTYDPAARMIISANLGGARVATLPVAADATIGPVSPRIHESGSGPEPGQKSSHSHSAMVDPSGQWALICNLGADRIYIHRVDAAGQRCSPMTAAPHAFAIAPGIGPRHIAFHSGGRLAFIADESTGGLQSFRWDALQGRMTLLTTLSTILPGFTSTPSVVEMEISHDGRILAMSTGARTRC